MAYIGKTPSQATRSRFYYTATGGETSLSGSDDNGNTLVFSDGNYVDVMLNGVTLVAGTDYNTSTANTIAGLTALTADDVVEIVVYDTFSVFGGDVKGDFTVSNGTLSADTVDINGGNIDGTTIGGSTPAAGSFTDLTADGLTVDGDSKTTTLKINTASSAWADANADDLIIRGADVGITLSSTGAGNIYFGDSTSAIKQGQIEYLHSSDSMLFSTNATERMRIESDGDIKASTGAGWVGTVAESSLSSVMDRGSNGNGYYIRYADGTVLIWRTGTVAYTNAARLTTTFSLPVTLSTTTGALAQATIGDASSLESLGYDKAGPVVSYVTSTTQVQVRVYSNNNNFSSGDELDFNIFVSGFWY